MRDSTGLIERLLSGFAQRAWTDSALCADAGEPHLWDGNDPAATQIAVGICRSCPVRLDCLLEGHVVDRVFGGSGVWGGFDAKGRAALRRSGKPRGGL